MPLHLKIKNLTVLTANVLRPEAFGFFSCIKSQRNLFTQSILLSRIIHQEKSEINDEKYFESQSSPSNFGKIIDLDVNFDEVKDDQKIKRGRRRNRKLSKNLKVNEATNNQSSEKDSTKYSPPKLTYFKVLDQNASTLGSLMMKLKNKKERASKKFIILEGKRLIYDAISSGFAPSQIFYSSSSDLENLSLPDEVKKLKVPYKSLSLWSDVVKSQGVIGIFKTPDLKTLESKANCIPLTIICDNIRDPGNLGSILRIVASVGCKKLILTKGCVDIWEPKVLRAGAGAHFRLPIKHNLLWPEIENEISEDSKVVLADFSYSNPEAPVSDGQFKRIKNPFKTKNEISGSLPLQCYYYLKFGDMSTVFVIGGETHGLSTEAYEFAINRKGMRTFIPMNNEVESLNSSVALGILTYEFKRQFHFITDKESQFQTTDYESSRNES